MSRRPKINPLAEALRGELADAELRLSLARQDVANWQMIADHLRKVLDREKPPPETPAAPKRAAPGDVAYAIVRELSDGPLNLDYLENATGQKRSSIRKALAALMRAGKVYETPAGTWALREAAKEEAAE